MYQALYRKYRPTTLSDVSGQDVIVKTLMNAVINNKLSHAYLFSGPRGTGKTSVAKIIGKMANCEDLIDGEPCNKCVNCTQINLGESVDLIEIDAASNNGVDEIRELKSKVNLVPNTGKYKIYIIDEVHMLTVGAFNALLKTLEEPPSHIIFILATTEPHKIPATILSRCQRYDFKKISINSIVDRLKYIIDKEDIIVEPGSLEEIARLSDGGMRDSVNLLDQAVSFSDKIIKIDDVHSMNGTISQNELKGFIENILENDYKEIFIKVDRYNEDGKNLIKLTDEIIYFLRNVLIYKIIPTHFINNEEKIYDNISKKIDENKLINMIEVFNNSTSKMKISNNPKIILETTIISLSKNEKKGDKPIKQKEKTEPKKEENSIEIKIKKNDSKVKVQANVEVKEQLPNDVIKELVKFENIRINNTLAEFDKQELLKLKQNYDGFRTLILNPDYGEIISLVLEGQLRAASQTHIVMMFEQSWMKNKFNSLIKEIEPVFKEIYNKNYAVIATDTSTWEIYKNDFNNKRKIFTYIDEPNIEQIIVSNEQKTEIENSFDNIIEYN